MNRMCLYTYIGNVKGIGGGVHVHVHVFGNRRRVRVTYICRLEEQAYQGISYIYMIDVVFTRSVGLEADQEKW